MRYVARIIIHYSFIGFISFWASALFSGAIAFMIWPLVGELLSAILETRRGHIFLLIVLWIFGFIKLIDELPPPGK